jgi:hypothetical protein
MGDRVNSPTFNAVAWITSATMIVLTLVLVFAALFPGKMPGGAIPGIQ